MKGHHWMVVAAVLFGATLWMLRGSGERPHTVRREPDTGSEQPKQDSETDGAATPNEADLLRAALAGGNAHAIQEAAAALRRAIRTGEAARSRAEALLLAEETPRELRMALALVLGTLPGNDHTLLNALRLFRSDTDVVRCLIHGLGATRDPPEDDDVFGLGDRPWGVHGPKGLGITVRRRIEDPEVLAVVAAHLRDGLDPVREAAAVALRHSTAVSKVRSEFLSALRAEPRDDVALVLGEALAVWAGGAKQSAEQTQVVSTLLARVGDEGLDGFRFRMEDDFRRIELNAEQRATLVEYAQPARPFTVRSFALSALAAAAKSTARPLLEKHVAGDRDVAVRDLSARLLGTLPIDAGTIVVLVTASRDDPAWNVRYQAVDALGHFRNDEKATAAIQAASGDADQRVAARARALMKR